MAQYTSAVYDPWNEPKLEYETAGIPHAQRPHRADALGSAGSQPPRHRAKSIHDLTGAFIPRLQSPNTILASRQHTGLMYF